MRRVILTFVSMAVIWGAMGYLLRSGNFDAAFVMFAVCGFFGWPVLYKLTPSLFVFVVIFIPWTQILIYVLVKIILAVMIGFFAAPFVVGKKLGAVQKGPLLKWRL